jgi:hypothetical protein
MISLMLLFWGGQFIMGWKEHNIDRKDDGQTELSMSQYLTSGHFVQATFENWESEFLQMGLYVFLTVWLRQQGSAESKKLEGESDEPEEVDREPDPKRKDAPGPVKKGGIWLKLYSHSLSIVLLLFFLISMGLHFAGSYKDNNEEQRTKGKPEVSAGQYLGEPRFWFESFQNWQSEFLAVASIVLLSVWLRQKGSPESKPVDAPHTETGK